MPVEFAKGQTEVTNVVESVDTDGDGEATITLPELIILDDVSSVIASVVDADYLGHVAHVTGVDTNDVTITLSDASGDAAANEAGVDIAFSAQGY